MKKFFMIFGLALVAGVGVFALTDSFAEIDLSANVISDMGCGCADCGSDCQCGDGVKCGHAACSCDKAAGQSKCGAATGGECSQKASCASGGSCASEAGGCAKKHSSCGCGKKQI